jgi:hypothetical protein
MGTGIGLSSLTGGGIGSGGRFRRTVVSSSAMMVFVGLWWSMMFGLASAWEHLPPEEFRDVVLAGGAGARAGRGDLVLVACEYFLYFLFLFFPLYFPFPFPFRLSLSLSLALFSPTVGLFWMW